MPYAPSEIGCEGCKWIELALDCVQSCVEDSGVITITFAR
jgi:hypothetical protein